MKEGVGRVFEYEPVGTWFVHAMLGLVKYIYLYNMPMDGSFEN